MLSQIKKGDKISFVNNGNTTTVTVASVSNLSFLGWMGKEMKGGKRYGAATLNAWSKFEGFKITSI